MCTAVLLAAAVAGAAADDHAKIAAAETSKQALHSASVAKIVAAEQADAKSSVCLIAARRG